MNKKAQGLSINVIIIVAIALIVLVVLIAIFTGRLGSFVGGLESTANCASSCKSFGMDKSSINTKDTCTSSPTDTRRKVPGRYADIPEGNTFGCCCEKPVG